MFTKFLDEFMEGKGRLPSVFSEPYDLFDPSDIVFLGTPFEPFLEKMRKKVTFLRNESNISKWIYFDGSIGINEAVDCLGAWVRAKAERNDLLRDQKYGYSVNAKKMDTCYDNTMMVVVEDGRLLQTMTNESKEQCKKEHISFCTVLGENKLYDFIEEKEKEIRYVIYLKKEEETYAGWYLA